MRRLIESLIFQYGLIIVLAMVFIGELGIPTGIPVEVALFLAGAYVVHSPAGLLIGLVCVVVADLLGASTLYLGVRAGGVRLLNRFLRGKQDKALSVLQRWRSRLGGRDIGAVCGGRLLPVARMYVTIASALAEIPLPRFLLGSLPASLFWSGIPLTLGYLLRADAKSIAASSTHVFNLLIIAIVAAVALVVLVWWLRRGRSIRVWLYQSRVAIGAGVAVLALAYIVATWHDIFLASSRHLPLPVVPVEAWMGVLGLTCLALMTIAAFDFRSVLQRDRRLAVSGVMTTEFVSTILWSALIIGACAIMLGLELHYPAL